MADTRYQQGKETLKSGLLKALRDNLSPPPRLSLSEWAEKYAVLSRETSAQTGRFKAFPYQVGMLDAVTDPSVTQISVMKSARVGYALSLETALPTPSGWTKMGDVAEGDYLLGADGKPCRVSYVSPVYTNHNCYAVTFCDGTTVIADAGHEWSVESDVSFESLRGDRPKGRIGRPKPGESVTKSGVIKTSEMHKMVKTSQGRNALAVRNTKPLELPDVDVPLHPYAFGVWLGDGASTEYRITSHRSDADEMFNLLSGCGFPIRIEYNDKRFPDNASIVSVCSRPLYRMMTREEIVATGYSQGCGRYVKFGDDVVLNPQVQTFSSRDGRRMAAESLRSQPENLRATLKRMGVWKNKHVPSLYLRGSVNQRLSLLQGLMDTDGTIGSNGFAEFSNTNVKLAEAVFDLASSLGYKPRMSSREVDSRDIEFIHNGKDYNVIMRKPLLRVVFKPIPSLNPFRLERKASRVLPVAKPTITFRRKIVSVEPTNTVPVRCVSVENEDHLYLCTRSMVPTHNTKCLDHVVGYYIHQDPSPILMVQPRVEDGEDYSKTEISPMLRDTKVLAELTGSVKAKDSNQTILKKTFLNGSSLSIVGANSPGGFRRITARIILFDEVDGYPTGGAGSEGDQIALGTKRSETFWNRKIVIGSTPTIKGESRIEKSYLESDQRKFYVPCPHCGQFQVLEWGGPDTPFGIKWDKDEAGKGIPDTAYYVCKENGCVIHDIDKPEMVGKGEWRATKPFNGHAGFHIWAGYSLFPNASWRNLVAEWLRVKSDPLLRQTFINLVLGEPYEDRGEKALNEHRLVSRCEVWPGEVPHGVAVITVGIDTQDYRFELEVVGWGANEESWSIDYDVIEGDMETPDPWNRLDAYLKRIWLRADGREFAISAACMDSGGHHTQKVYDFCKARLGRKVWAIKGESAIGGKRSPVWPTKRPSSRNKSAFRPIILGVNAAKDSIRSRLHIENPGPGYMHFPTDRDINYFAQLTSERSVRKATGGQYYRVWELPPGRANEALDCRVYSYAALCGLIHFGLKLNKRADEAVKSLGIVPTLPTPPTDIALNSPPQAAVVEEQKPQKRSLVRMLA